MNYAALFYFKDSGADEEANLNVVEVSEKTEIPDPEVHSESVQSGKIENPPALRVSATRMPQLDSYIKQEMSSGVKAEQATG